MEDWNSNDTSANPKKVAIRLMPEELAQNPKDVFLFNATLERQGERNPRDILQYLSNMKMIKNKLMMPVWIAVENK